MLDAADFFRLDVSPACFPLSVLNEANESSYSQRAKTGMACEQRNKISSSSCENVDGGGVHTQQKPLFASWIREIRLRISVFPTPMSFHYLLIIYESILSSCMNFERRFSRAGY
jgi:hypothetical protein